MTDPAPSADLTPGDIRAALRAALEHLQHATGALREIAATVYDGRAIADARAVATEAAAIRAAMMPEMIMDTIIEAVAAQFDVTPQMILGPRKDRVVVTARHAAMWMGGRRGLSTNEIGRAMNRDHASVINGQRNVDRAFQLAEARA